MTANSPAYRTNFCSYANKKMVDGALPLATYDRLLRCLRQDFNAGAISQFDYDFCHEYAALCHYERVAA